MDHDEPDSIAWEDGVLKEVYNLCSDSDLCLEGDRAYKREVLLNVSTSIMAFCSPVFGKMLGSNFKEVHENIRVLESIASLFQKMTFPPC